jgi:hypothetical protein
MIKQATERQQTESMLGQRRLTAQEIERMTQPLYERSLAEMKAEWAQRFKDRQRQSVVTKEV